MKTSPLLILFLWSSLIGLAGNGNAGVASDQPLRILSYNIKMLPRFIKRTHHFPITRARIIPEFLAEENPDIIVFQEAFDPKADRILRTSLKQVYPYMIGPVNKK